MNTEPDVAFIARSFGRNEGAALSPGDVDALAEVVSSHLVPVDTSVFSQHDPSTNVFIVKTGRVVLSRPSHDRTPYLQILGPGDVFGDVGVLLGRDAPVDALTFEDSELLMIKGRDLLELVAARPRLALRWLTSIAERLADVQDRLEDLLAGPLDFQLASLLLHTADEHGCVFASQQTIAHLLGAQRASITRGLAHLEQQGLIAKHYGRIEVLNSVKLESLVR